MFSVYSPRGEGAGERWGKVVPQGRTGVHPLLFSLLAKTGVPSLHSLSPSLHSPWPGQDPPPRPPFPPPARKSVPSPLHLHFPLPQPGRGSLSLSYPNFPCQPGQGYPPSSQLRQGYPPSLPSPTPSPGKTGVPSLPSAPPWPGQGWNSCAARAICLLHLRRRTVLLVRSV